MDDYLVNNEYLVLAVDSEFEWEVESEVEPEIELGFEPKVEFQGRSEVKARLSL